eukprot:CAMPEP_0176228058 /NCGR_PEP_ID=MMETSP0121_2-20121125/23080_1 /TAXON_ID=160619 /ORGANISM="Kryptoperidinium foliaceum, Strain CCMP 1326" /LENGTH=80 /DNA_ID=CAMNT_0017567343 /DNA_START=256 /DNA_END=495 /DNA_ORIENTATION=-
MARQSVRRYARACGSQTFVVVTCPCLSGIRAASAAGDAPRGCEACVEAPAGGSHASQGPADARARAPHKERASRRTRIHA